MLQRVPEPELMDDDEQARAYAEADFSEPHDLFVRRCTSAMHGRNSDTLVLDLGCGPADVTVRFALAHPAVRIDGIDGAEAMLQLGRQRITDAGLGDRIRLYRVKLPALCEALTLYDVILSNSLLHHLEEPSVLWHAIRRYAGPGASVCIMDLRRPSELDDVKKLVERYAADAPPVLRRDFEASLCAAYTTDEVEQQLVTAGLTGLRVESISDRHLWVSGRL